MHFGVDFEADYGLYIDNDAMFGDFRVDGFMLSKQWNTFKATAVVARNNNFGTGAALETDKGEAMTYALDLTWQPSEAFFVGINGVWRQEDGDIDPYGPIAGYNGDAYDMATYSAYASYNFTPAIALQGIYYWQDLDEGIVNELTTRDRADVNATEDSPRLGR